MAPQSPLKPTPAQQLLDISKLRASRHGYTLEAARREAQLSADRLGQDIAMGWQLNDTTCEKELGWCPASVAPHNAFVIEILEIIKPREA